MYNHGLKATAKDKKRCMKGKEGYGTDLERFGEEEMRELHSKHKL